MCTRHTENSKTTLDASGSRPKKNVEISNNEFLLSSVFQLAEKLAQSIIVYTIRIYTFDLLSHSPATRSTTRFPIQRI